MARIIEPMPAPGSCRTKPYRHSCGALVQFDMSDVKRDEEGEYVVCPACDDPRVIPDETLEWESF